MKESFQGDPNPIGITERFRKTRLVEPIFQKALRAGRAEAAQGAHVGHGGGGGVEGGAGGGVFSGPPVRTSRELASWPFTTPLPGWAAEDPGSPD